MINKNTLSLLLAAAATASLLQGQTLLYEFQFNDPANGTNTTATGTPGGTAAFTDNNNVDHLNLATDLHGSSGSGVSGRASDYAFDNTGSTKMGGSGSSAGYGGMAAIAGGASPLEGMSSFTISGWYYSSTTPGNYARLIEVGSTGVWFQGSSMQLSTKVTSTTDTQMLASNDSSLFATNTWNFFAFTYDGTTGTATLYAGTDENSVKFITSSNLATGDITLSNSNLTIGNSNFNDHERPFDGLLDNYRVWASEDASGALDMATLESVRAGDVIPEPSTYAAMLGLSILALAWLRRRR